MAVAAVKSKILYNYANKMEEQKDDGTINMKNVKQSEKKLLLLAKKKQNKKLNEMK